METTLLDFIWWVVGFEKGLGLLSFLKLSGDLEKNEDGVHCTNSDVSGIMNLVGSYVGSMVKPLLVSKDGKKDVYFVDVGLTFVFQLRFSDDVGDKVDIFCITIEGVLEGILLGLLLRTIVSYDGLIVELPSLPKNGKLDISFVGEELMFVFCLRFLEDVGDNDNVLCITYEGVLEDIFVGLLLWIVGLYDGSMVGPPLLPTNGKLDG